MKNALFVLLLVSCAHAPRLLPAGDPRIAIVREAIALEDAARPEEARDKWLSLLGSGEPALDVLGASRILAIESDVPGDAQLLSRLRAAQVGFEARQMLDDVAARIARRAGDEKTARELDAERGCPTEWTVAPRLGGLPHGDLESPIRKGPSRQVPVRGCRAQLAAADGRAGAIAVLIPTSGPKLLMVDAFTDWILVRGGKVLHRHGDRSRFPARTTWLRVGKGPLELRLAAPTGRVEAAIALLPADRAEGGDAEEISLPEVPIGGADGALVRAYLLLARGDGDGVEVALAGRKDAPALMARARAATIEQSRSYTTAHERTRAMLTAALAADPAVLRASYELAQLDLQDDRAREAAERLEAGASKVRWSGWQILLSQTLRGRGLSAAADRALGRVENECLAVRERQAAARERHDFAGEHKLAERAKACDADSQALADLCAAQGELDCAISEYRRLLSADPSRDPLRLSLADALVAAGRPREAADVLQVLCAHDPRQASYRQKWADALWAAGDTAGARTVLREAALAMPESLELWRALELAGEPGPLEAFRLDGRKVIAAFEARKQHPQSDAAPAVVLLDRTVVRAFSTGARLTLTHNIIRVQSKAGIDHWGEVRVPQGADVLLLRTVKADGSTREPEEIAEKESVSAPDLEPGDYVEFEYVVASPPPAAFPGGFLAERFYFVSSDDPLDRTEYVVATPVGMPVDVDARGGMAAEEKRTRVGDLEVRTWARREVPRRIPEPGETPYRETAPSARVSSGLSFARWRAFLDDATFSSWRENAELGELARNLCAGKKGRACAETLDGWVADNIEHGGMFTDLATATLGRRQGNRTSLLAALLRANGIDFDVWLVRPRTSDATAPVPQEIDDFDQPILHLDEGFLDPRTRRLPPWSLQPLLAGARALELHGAEAFVTVPIGKTPDEGRRRVLLRANLEGKVEVREDLDGWMAVEWRELRDATDASRLRQDFEQRSLGFYFPGAQLDALELRGFDTRRAGPVTLEYKFTAPRLLRESGPKQRTLAPILPDLLVRRWVGLPSRTTPLQIGIVAPTDLDVTLALPQGAVAHTPPPVELVTPFGKFSQKVWAERGTLRIVRHVEVPYSRVAPADYPRLVSFARAVDEAEQSEIEIDLSR